MSTFSYSLLSPLSPPLFSKPSETWRGVSTSRGKVCRPGGKDAGRRSARDTRAEQLSDIHGWQITRSTGHVLMKLYRAVCSRVGWKMKNETTPSCPMNSLNSGSMKRKERERGRENERLLFVLIDSSFTIDHWKSTLSSFRRNWFTCDWFFKQRANNIDLKIEFGKTRKGIDRNDFWRFFRYNFLEINVLPIKGNRCSLKKNNLEISCRDS